MKMNFFTLIITLLLFICNVRGEDCNYCNCSKKEYEFYCDCTTAMCSKNEYNNILISENIKIASNITSSRIKEIVIHDLPLKSLSFLQKLDHLQNLTLKSCNITKIQKNNFHNVERLKRLTIENNNIQEVNEDTFDYVPELFYIHLKNNTIQKISGKILKNLTDLAHLNLEENIIEELYSSLFTDNTKLETIYLNKNSIKELPNIIFNGLTSVDKINLGDNKLQKLPEGIFSNLNNLKEVNLKNNKITSIGSNAFEGSSKLENIDLDGNDIQNMDPYILVKLPTLNYIGISKSSINCDCKMKTFFSTYKERGISGNIHCASPTNLSNKHFTDLSNEDFACKPKILDCFNETSDKIHKIACKINADPQPEIIWNLNDHEVNENELYDLTLTSINEDTYWSNLTIFSISESTIGLYKLKAQNKAGAEFRYYKYNYLTDQNIQNKMLGNMKEQSSTTRESAITILVFLSLAFVISILIVAISIYLKKYSGKSGDYNLQENESQDKLLHGRKSIILPIPTANIEQLKRISEGYPLSTDMIDHSSYTDHNYYPEEKENDRKSYVSSSDKEHIKNIPIIMNRGSCYVPRIDPVSTSSIEVCFMQDNNYGIQSLDRKYLVNAVPKPARSYRSGHLA